MRPSEIEYWVLDIIDRVISGQPNEDTRVELKTDWIKPVKAARRLAGHANAARGDSILWIIGVNQSGIITGAEHRELANWYSAVVSEFNSTVPQMTDVNVRYEDNVVIALHFRTDRAPYVVRNPSFGQRPNDPIEFEVPWREGTRTRSARREDLIRLLIPATKGLRVEILKGKLTLTNNRNLSNWHLDLELYVVPVEIVPISPIVIPFHRSSASVKLVSSLHEINFGNSISLSPPYHRYSDSGSTIGTPLSETRWVPDSITISHTGSELIVSGPGRVDLSCTVRGNEVPANLDDSTVKVNVNLASVNMNEKILIEATLHWDSQSRNGEGARWTLKKDQY